MRRLERIRERGRISTDRREVQIPAHGEKTAILNGRYRTRTYDPLIKSQLSTYCKTFKKRRLEKLQPPTVVPAYKKDQETTDNSNAPLHPKLVEIVAAWPQLPEHIKQAILALIKTA